MEVSHWTTPRVHPQPLAVAGSKSPRSTQLAQSRRGDGNALRLHSWTGLGDVLRALAVGYAAAEAGYEVNIDLEQPSCAPLKSVLDISALSPLPLVTQGEEGNWTDIRAALWAVPDCMLRAADYADVGFVSTPRYGMLQKPSGSVWTRLNRLKLKPPYVLLCMGGHWADDIKALTVAQAEAVAQSCDRVNAELIVVGAQKTGDTLPGRDLRGETPIDELCALVSEALCVVTAETGVAHLANSLNTPCIVVSPEKTVPGLPYVCPVGYVTGETAASVSEERVVAAFERMVTAAQTPWVMGGWEHNLCGVALVARRIAAAAGVPCVPFGERDPNTWAVYEYLDDYRLRVPTRRTILSAHKDGLPNYSQFPAVIWQSAQFLDWHRAECKRAHYIPLPVGEGREEDAPPAHPRHIMWHGHVHRRKGLPIIVDAFARLRETIPDAILTLLAGTGVHDPGEQAWLDALYLRIEAGNAPGIVIDQKDFWEPADLHKRLLGADLFVHGENEDGEQSAASAEELPYRRPVVVSQSTRHDEIRGWCATPGGMRNDPGELSRTLADTMLDPEKYKRLCERAGMGASYRKERLVARQYRAVVTQAVYDEGAER